MGSENAHGCTQNTENGFGFEFLGQYRKHGDEFLNHIIICDEVSISFMNVETKQQSKQWMQTHSPNKPKKFTQMLFARKPMATIFWDRKGVLMVEFMS
jgi:hypothetical protein